MSASSAPTRFHRSTIVAARARWVVAALLCLGFIEFLPAIRSEFLLDDYMHTAMIDGTFCVARGPFDLYDFVGDTDRAVLEERGVVPWWSHPKLKIRFLRPLSSALRWGEHRLLGRRPLLFHLHSFAWWVAAVLAARALFRRALGGRAATLATAIFALAPCHTLPIAWLANREALVSLVLGTLALAAYVRWRGDGGGGGDDADGDGDSDPARDRAAATRAGLASAALFAAAMASGEYALSFAGYVGAFEIVRARARSRSHSPSPSPSPTGRGVLVGVLPFGVPAVAYLVTRAALGYGTAGSGFYADPLEDPLGFAKNAPWHAVALLAQGWLTVDTDGWETGIWRWALGAAVVVAAVLLVGPVRRAFAALDDARRRSATWLLGGSFVALVPVLAVMPSARVLGVSALGTSAIVALLLDHAWFARSPSPSPSPSPSRGAAEVTATVAVLLGFAHFVHGPVSASLSAAHFRETAADFAAHAKELRARIGAGPADLTRAEVVVVRGLGGMFFGPFALDPRGVAPARWRILSHTGHALVLRKDARTIDLVVPRDQAIFPGGHGNLFRTPDAPLRAGDEIVVPGMRATVLEVGPKGPRDVRFVFDRDLDAAPIVLVAEGNDGFREAALPLPGFGAPFDP